MSDSFIISLQIIANDPFRIFAQKGQCARPINSNGLFLKDQSVSNVRIVGVKTKIDAETCHHTGKNDVVCVFALRHSNLDDVD
jgi:hypothetical protein